MHFDKESETTLATVLLRGVILLTGLFFGFILLRIFITPYTITDDSMMPNLKKGDIIFIHKTNNYAFGDIILFKSPVEPEKVLLKRVVAKAGDIVEVKNKVFYRNNTKVNFKWNTISPDLRIFPLNYSTRDIYPLIKIKQGTFFVLGDNLDTSMDSRAFGPVREDSIIGIMVYKM